MKQTLLDAAEAQARTDPGSSKRSATCSTSTRGSQSLLNVQAFKDPTAYKLKVKRAGLATRATR